MPAATVLVLDDDPLARRSAAAALAAAGHAVWTAADGEAGLEAILRLQPDVVVLAQDLPHRAGVEVAAAVRAHALLADVRLILVSRRASRADVERGYVAGVDRFLATPVVPAELVAHVHDVLTADRPFGPVVLASAG